MCNAAPFGTLVYRQPFCETVHVFSPYIQGLTRTEKNGAHLIRERHSAVFADELLRLILALPVAL